MRQTPALSTALARIRTAATSALSRRTAVFASYVGWLAERQEKCIFRRGRARVPLPGEQCDSSLRLLHGSPGDGGAVSPARSSVFCCSVRRLVCREERRRLYRGVSRNRPPARQVIEQAGFVYEGLALRDGDSDVYDLSQVSRDPKRSAGAQPPRSPPSGRRLTTSGRRFASPSTVCSHGSQPRQRLTNAGPDIILFLSRWRHSAAQTSNGHSSG